MTKTKLFAFAAAVAAFLPAAAQAEDRRVRIVNETNDTMLRFYASNVERDNWEEDILGNRVLKPGQSVTVNVDDGTGHCKFDFRADFDNGQKLTRNGINVCTTSVYRYTE